MNILIADDHDLYREALAGLVSKCFPNSQVMQSGNFTDLLSKASTQSHWFAFIIDLNMPEGELSMSLRQLQNEHPATPIIIISASEQPEDTQKAMREGALGYISKSMNNEEICQSLELMLNCGVSIHPATSGQSAKTQQSNIAPLTPRQKEVLIRMCDGASNKRIALDLGLSESTVKIHVRAILHSLDVTNRTEAVIKAKAESLI